MRRSARAANEDARALPASVNKACNAQAGKYSSSSAWDSKKKVALLCLIMMQIKKEIHPKILKNHKKAIDVRIFYLL
jgi:hypothetical protein